MDTILQWRHAFNRYDVPLREWSGSLLSLAFRLFVGWQFFKAGIVKVQDWDATLALFRYEYQVPLLPPAMAAFFGASGELFFPLLLAIGWWSRVAALGLFGVNVMAVISYPALFQFECPAAINDHFYWGALLLALAAFGPGRFSLDAFRSKD